MKIKYESHNFSRSTMEVIDEVNRVVADYQAQGYMLTLRSLYYRMVASGFLHENTQKQYKRLGSIINDGRLAGLIDWSAIEDRTRSLKGTSHWDSPADIISSAAYSYRRDKWVGQPRRCEIWVEKDALGAVVDRVARELDISWFSTRGNPSQSETWGAGRRLAEYVRRGQTPLVLHLGDHDPTGIDITRDIESRLSLFAEGYVEVKRLALNMDQVEQYDPPPNDAKVTDSRYRSYVERYGELCYELDALDPPVLAALIRDAVLAVRDEEQWDSLSRVESREIDALKYATKSWPAVEKFLLDKEGLRVRVEDDYAEEDEDDE